MKKYFSAIALMAVILSPALALADTITLTHAVGSPGVYENDTYTASSPIPQSTTFNVMCSQSSPLGDYTTDGTGIFAGGNPVISSFYSTAYADSSDATLYAQGHPSGTDPTLWEFKSPSTIWGQYHIVFNVSGYGGMPCGAGNLTLTYSGSTSAVSAGGLPVTSFLPTSTAPTLMAYAGGLLADPGTLALFAMIVGVPLGFVLISYLIPLAPGEDKKRRRK